MSGVVCSKCFNVYVWWPRKPHETFLGAPEWYNRNVFALSSESQICILMMSQFCMPGSQDSKASYAPWVG